MVPAHRVIPGVLAQIIRPAPLCQEKVAFAWRSAVGPSVDRVCTIRWDERGILQVTVPNAHWRREVRRSLAVIRHRLEALLGPDAVKDVEIICHE